MNQENDLIESEKVDPRGRKNRNANKELVGTRVDVEFKKDLIALALQDGERDLTALCSLMLEEYYPLKKREVSSLVANFIELETGGSIIISLTPEKTPKLLFLDEAGTQSTMILSRENALDVMINLIKILNQP